MSKKIRVIVHPPFAPEHGVSKGNVYEVLADGATDFTAPSGEVHPGRRASLWVLGKIEPVRLLFREYEYVKGES